LFLIDCRSPISQKILEIKLTKYIESSKDFRYIITDKKLNGSNIIKIGKDINFPFSKKQIEKYILSRSEKQNKIEIGQNRKEESDIQNLREEIFRILDKNNRNILNEIEGLLETK